jgi:hypothetical protein
MSRGGQVVPSQRWRETQHARSRARHPPPLPRESPVVSNCTQLQAQLADWRARMDGGGPAHTYRLTLACPADGGRYDDCAKPDDSYAVLPAVVRLSGAGSVFVAAGRACASGAARPALSAAGSDGARLFVVTGPKARLSLSSLVLDGLGSRPGIWAENAAGLALGGVALRNFNATAACDFDPRAASACGGALLAYATPATLTGCELVGNRAAFGGSDGAGLGGAIYAGAPRPRTACAWCGPGGRRRGRLGGGAPVAGR